jgi:hypothetical protein
MKSDTIKGLVILLATLPLVSAQAINWDGGGVGNNWSNPTNWVGDNVPDNNTESAAFVGAANVAINVDTNFTIQSYTDGFGGEGFTNTLYGAGTLTIDRNQNGFPALLNATGNGGGTLRLNVNGGIVINNSAGGNTLVRNDNSSGNVTLFDTGSKLTLATVLQTANGAGGSIHFNGQFLSSSANLVIGSDNVSFGEGHNSSSFGRDIVFNAGGKLVVDGGTVLAPFRKFQVNGSASMELNGTNSINGANIVVDGANNLMVYVNADQDNLGFLKFGTGTVTLDLADGISGISFADSSAQTWGAGALVISNFISEVIQFGTNSTGLTAGQLSQTTAYDDTGAEVTDLGISSSGFLTGTVSGGGPVDVGDIQIDPINGGSAITISWASTNGANYGVSNTADLVSGSWSLLTNGVIGTGGTLYITNQADLAVEFFKVFSE